MTEKSQVVFNCEQCDVQTIQVLSHYKKKKHHFCGVKCYGNYKKGKVSHRKGISYEEEYGKLKADFIKNTLSKIHKGKHYSKKSELKKGSKIGFWFGRDRNMNGKKNPVWKGCKSFEPYSIDFNNKLKNKIRKRDNYICQECGIKEKNIKTSSGKKWNLIIHHIDYNKKNNEEDNLISLCLSCHGKTGFKRNNWEEYFKSKIEGI